MKWDGFWTFGTQPIFLNLFFQIYWQFEIQYRRFKNRIKRHVLLRVYIHIFMLSLHMLLHTRSTPIIYWHQSTTVIIETIYQLYISLSCHSLDMVYHPNRKETANNAPISLVSSPDIWNVFDCSYFDRLPFNHSELLQWK